MENWWRPINLSTFSLAFSAFLLWMFGCSAILIGDFWIWLLIDIWQLAHVFQCPPIIFQLIFFLYSDNTQIEFIRLSKKKKTFCNHCKPANGFNCDIVDFSAWITTIWMLGFFTPLHCVHSPSSYHYYDGLISMYFIEYTHMHSIQIAQSNFCSNTMAFICLNQIFGTINSFGRQWRKPASKQASILSILCIPCIDIKHKLS